MVEKKKVRKRVAFMRKKGSANKIEFWRNRARATPPWKRRPFVIRTGDTAMAREVAPCAVQPPPAAPVFGPAGVYGLEIAQAMLLGCLDTYSEKRDTHRGDTTTCDAG